MKTVLGRVVRNASLDCNGTIGVMEDTYIAKWYKDKDIDYSIYTNTVFYMSPVGMPRKYGFWAPPELWTRVLIGQPDNAPDNYWVYLGSVYEQNQGYTEAKAYFVEQYEKGFRDGVAPIAEAYDTAIESQAYGFVTKGRNGIVLSDSLGKNTNKEVNNDNIGVFLTSGKGKFIRIQDNLPGNSIEIKNETGGDGITITSNNGTKKPIGDRAVDINTALNTRMLSREGSLNIEVGTGSDLEQTHGTTLQINNKSYAWGAQSKTVFQTDGDLEELKAEGCGSISIRSDWNDIEILSMRGRVMIACDDDIQIRTYGAAKVYADDDIYVEGKKNITLNATQDITIQSKEGDINLKALKGEVNIETGEDDINIQSGDTGSVHLNKVDPATVTLAETPSTDPSKFNQELLTEKLENGEIFNPL